MVGAWWWGLVSVFFIACVDLLICVLRYTLWNMVAWTLTVFTTIEL